MRSRSEIGLIGAEEIRKACDRFFKERGMPIRTFRDGVRAQARKGKRIKDDTEKRDDQALQVYLDGDGMG